MRTVLLPRRAQYPLIRSVKGSIALGLTRSNLKHIMREERKVNLMAGSRGYSISAAQGDIAPEHDRREYTPGNADARLSANNSLNALRSSGVSMIILLFADSLASTLPGVYSLRSCSGGNISLRCGYGISSASCHEIHLPFLSHDEL